MEYKTLQINQLKKIAECTGGNPVYFFNADRFIENFIDLQSAFRKIYPNTFIAYSYKTNWIPGICKLVNDLGGYAEVVSPMECEFATKVVGCEKGRIIYNGLLTCPEMISISRSGMVNIASMEGLQYLLERNRNNAISGVGIRIAMKDDSRFGFLESELLEVIALLVAARIKVRGIHCHVGGSRSIEVWKEKTNHMLRIAKDIEKLQKSTLKYIDLGGHLYGRMDPELEVQFGSNVPTFEEYAETVATAFAETFAQRESMPRLILEPGTALVADAVSILARVQNVKKRKTFKDFRVATLNVSSFDCGMIADYKNLPIVNISRPESKSSVQHIVCGYTCMESDYINRECSCDLRTGDDILIKNCGAYSVSMKGNFIQPSIGMYKVNSNYEILEELKKPGKAVDAVTGCMIGGRRCVELQ